MKLLIADTFPTIEARTTTGTITLPGQFAGSWFVFFSHPGDFTPVCTTEFVGFQKRAQQFAVLDTKLIGLSVDDIDDHHAWIEWIQDHLQIGIDFPIIDDKDRSISLELGMLRPDQTESVTARSVIVVDSHGVVRTILEYPKELGRNIDEIVRIVKGLQLFDSTHLMAPANWPHNEIIGDSVLVPPSTELTATQVAEQHVTQLSDWFRYRATAAA
jgi:peroxiredoxin (alkyl hydroperoxide reductase subunit C)